MKSLDSNILLSAANEDCAKQALAAAMLNGALSAWHEWLPADQVLFEFPHRTLCNIGQPD
jgi:hypothetical protein